MASTDIVDVSPESETLTTVEFQKLQAEFANEAFAFLLHNAHLWIEYPKDFIIRHTVPDNCGVFTTAVGKAIITIAYLLRMEYRKEFPKAIRYVKEPVLYDAFLMYFPVNKNKSFCYNFLAWVAFAFSFTMYCYKEGHDYFERGEKCIASYRGIEYFNSQGGFYQLMEYSVYIAVIYDNIEPIISKKVPQDDVIVPFLKCIENIERRNRYINNRWMLVTPELRYAKQIRKKLSSKYDVVSSIGAGKVTTGYKVILKKSPTKSNEKDCSKSPEEPVSETELKSREVDDLIAGLSSRMDETSIEDCSGGSDVPVSETEPPLFSWGTNDAESVFIIHERFLDKRKAIRKDSDSKYECSLKIYSPLTERERVCMNLNEILNENIQNGNYSKIRKDVYAVCPPGRTIHNEDTRVIVLDTSSEEEDDGDSKPLDEILQAIWLKHQERERTKSESEKAESELKRSADLLLKQLTSASSKSLEPVTKEGVTEQSTEQSKSAKSKQSSTDMPSEKMLATSESNEAVTKESTKVHSEQKPFVPTKCTGAIPKVKNIVPKKSPKKEQSHR